MIISTLVLLKASHCQSVGRDLFTGFREWLDNIQSWPGTVFSFLGGKERERCVLIMLLETTNLFQSVIIKCMGFIISADVSPSNHLHGQTRHTMLFPDLLFDINRTGTAVSLQLSTTQLQGHGHCTLPQLAYTSFSPMWERVKIILQTAKPLPLPVSFLVTLTSHTDWELRRKQNMWEGNSCHGHHPMWQAGVTGG